MGWYHSRGYRPLVNLEELVIHREAVGIHPIQVDARRDDTLLTIPAVSFHCVRADGARLVEQSTDQSSLHVEDRDANR
jgi:hypothetical protein